jgi:glycosyltransferase involved in cell wall biosynthesis
VRICLSPGALGSGGIGRNMLNLAAAFERRGAVVDLVFTGDVHVGREAEIPAGVSVVQLAGRTRYALPAAVRYLRRQRPDMVISAHNHVNVLMLVARMLARADRTRVVCTFRTHRSVHMENSDRRGVLYDRLALGFYRRAHRLVAVSEGVARDMEAGTGLPAGSIDVIYNPAWTGSMAERSEATCEHRWLIGKTAPVVIGAGRLTRQKDFDSLIRAFGLVREVIDARLIILGEGEDRVKLEKLVLESGLSGVVDLPGHVVNPLAYFANADLFVLSSAWEGFGNVVVEALGCGLPVVSTNCPSGPAEILGHGAFGRLVPVGAVGEMAEAMKDLLRAPPSRERQRLAANRFTDDVAADQFLSLL